MNQTKESVKALIDTANTLLKQLNEQLERMNAQERKALNLREVQKTMANMQRQARCPYCSGVGGLCLHCLMGNSR